MGKSNGWKNATQKIDAPKLKRWYKKLIHRLNRRKAKLNPEIRDKLLEPWDID